MSEVFKKVIGLYLNEHSTKELIKGSLDDVYQAINTSDGGEKLNRVKKLTLDFYKKSDLREYSGFIMPEFDFYENMEFGFQKITSPENVVTLIHGANPRLIISTPEQLVANNNHVENKMDLMEYQDCVPLFDVKPVYFGFDHASYFRMKNYQKAIDFNFPYSNEIPYPFIPVGDVRKLLKMNSFKDFSGVNKIGVTVFPSVFYYFYCQEFGILQSDVNMDMFYDLAVPAIISGYF